MKKSITHILILIAFGFSNLYSQPGWVQQTSPVNIDLLSVSFVNENTGYACGGNKIIKTTNGGSIWFVFDSTVSTPGYTKIQFINQNTGLIGYGNNEIYKTTNSGVNWFLSSSYLDKFGLIDSLFGWGFVFNHMELTSDCGSSWYMGGGFPVTSCTGGSLGSRNFGIAVGYFDDFMHSKMYIYILKTQNGGNSWQCISGGVIGDPCAYNVIYQFHPPPPFTKTFVVDDFTAFLYGGTQNLRTNSSGSSWTSLNLAGSINGFDFINHTTGYALVGNGLIHYTTSSGNIWNPETSPVSIQLNSVDMASSTVGWIVGNSGTILKTTTGGLIWPLPPSLVSPVNNSTGVQLTPLLDWNDNLQAENYRVQISTDINFNTIIVDNYNLILSQYNVPSGSLTYNTVYYWRVAARNFFDWSPFSEIWNFRTFNLPAKVNLYNPPNNSIEQPTSLTFIWLEAIETLSELNPKSILTEEKLANSDIFYKPSETDAINKYWFELTTDTISFAGLMRDTTLSDTTKYVSGLNMSTTYYWRVKAKNPLGWGPFSDWWKFTTGFGPPLAPALNSPVNQSIQQPANLLFNWYKSIEITAKPVGNRNQKQQNIDLYLRSGDAITAYCFELTTDTITYSGIIRDSTLTDTTKQLSLSGISKTYFWRVKAKNQTGWGVFSSWWRFITIPSQNGWFLQASVDGNNCEGIFFINSQTGWICTADFYGKVFKSTDGGNSWSVSENWNMFAHDICFGSPASGVIAAGPYTGANYPIWTSQDGGVYWQPVAFTNYFASDIKSITLGWAVGTLTTFGNPQQTYSAIIELGNTEHLLYHTIPLNRIRAGKNYAWTVGNQGLVYRGLTSVNIGNDSVNLTGVSFNDDNTGYVVGGAYMFKSINNGSNWTRIYPLTNQTTYNDVYFANKDTGWVACSIPGQGAIIGTTNGGVSWSLQYIGPYGGADFTFAGNSNGWLLCGNNVLKTETGGNPPALTPPILLSPANGTTGLSTTPLLDWSDVYEATKYWIQISIDSGFNSIVVNDSNSSISQYSVSSGILFYNTTYYWRVKAGNNTLWGNFSDWWKFTTIAAAPTPPVLVSPANNEVGQNLLLTLIWNKSSTAVSYRVQLATDSLFTGLILNDSTLTDSTKEINGLNPLTYYWWRVNASNAGGTSAFSNVYKFRTLGYPNPVTLINPPNNAVNQPVSIQFNWSEASEQTNPFEGSDKSNLLKSEKTIALSNLTDIADAIGNYWFELVTDTVSMTNLLRDTTLIDTTKLVSGLTNLTNYFWRVKAKNQIGWGSYSVWFKFTTIISAPLPPVLVSPNNNAVGQNLSLTLVWNKSQTASTYRAQIATDSLFTNLILNDSTLSDSTKSVSGLTPLTYYWWRVNAKNTGGTSTYSSIFKFKTLGYPNQVTLINPPNNAVNQPVTIQFSWSSATEQMIPFENLKGTDELRDEIEAINGYWFELVSDTVSMANLTRDTTLTDTLKSVSGLSNLTNYYWRVKARNQIGWGQFSSWWKFTTILAAPSAPILLSPPNGATGVPVPVTFVWRAAATAASYRLLIALDSMFTMVIYNDSTITDTSKTVSGLPQPALLFWKVNAKNIGGTSPFSAMWRFTTETLFPTLNLKVYLEGFYTADPVDRNGPIQKNEINPIFNLLQSHVTDTIRIYLADSSSSYIFVDSAIVILSDSGTAATPFDNITTGKYYIIVRHRNHLETWSKYAVNFTAGNTTYYDFTTAANKAYGDNLKQKGSVYLIYGGDPNQDGDIGALDIPIFISQFGTQGYLSCDFNGDDDVTGVDQQILVQNYGITVSRPGTVVLNPANRLRLHEIQERIINKKNNN